MLEQAAQILAGQLGSNANTGNAASALTGLLGGSDGNLDLGSVVGQLNGGGLASLAASWLGDGANDAISAGDIVNLFPAEKLNSFAQALGIDQPEAVNALSQALPRIIDAMSSGGNLLDAAGGAGGLMDMAKKLF